MLVVSYVLCFSSLLHPLLANKELHFPGWFKFGAATSSYQIEGSWNVSDKAISIWDDYTHTQPHKIKDHSNGDVACDSYNQYEKDIEMAEQLGLDFYRFSISWSRLLPEGYRTRISSDGRQYYDNLINGLLDRGIEPMVTLYHSEMPKMFQDLGGWANPEMAEWFADYADVAFSLYGDRVKLWITINEPSIICDSSAYVLGVVEPFLAPYLCSKTVLMAHAKAYHNYKKNYKPMYQGKVGIAHAASYFSTKTQNDAELAELFRQYHFGIFMHPIHSKSGGWPAIVVELMKNISSVEGFPRSRLPPLTKHEVEFIRGTNDFLGLNYYTSCTVRKAKAGEKRQESLGDLPELNAIFEPYPNSTASYPEYYSSYPEGLRAFIAWFTKNYGVQDIFITENGYTSYTDDLNDFNRITYIEKHLEKILLCIYEDGARIHGYTYWSLMDNFEWRNGYTAKFGLYDVDFSDVDRKRTPRLSAQYYSYVIKSRSIDSNKWKSQMEDTNE